MSNTLLTNFLIELKKQAGIWYEMKWRKLNNYLRSGFISKESHVFVEKEDNPSEKVVIFEEELYCVGII